MKDSTEIRRVTSNWLLHWRCPTEILLLKNPTFRTEKKVNDYTKWCSPPFFRGSNE